MKDSLTPKQVSRALQVSESSVKRWCDKGVIPTQYTAGGHRKIPVNGLVEFLRSTNRELVDPSILGLPKTLSSRGKTIENALPIFQQALLKGDESQCKQLVLELYLADISFAAIGDDLIAKAFENVGKLWECREAEVYQERLGCEIAMRILHELRLMQSVNSPERPLALGGAVEGDQYQLGTAMVELVLRELKWNAISLGDNLPFETLDAAIIEHHPNLFWISCSHLQNEETFLPEFNALYEKHHVTTTFVVGGRALTEPLRKKMKYTVFCDTLQHLETFVKTLQSTKSESTILDR